MDTAIDPESFKRALTSSETKLAQKIKATLLCISTQLFEENASIENRANVDQGRLALKLYTTGCDGEQIWQQVDQQQRKTLDRLSKYKQSIASDIEQLKNVQDSAEEEADSELASGGSDADESEGDERSDEPRLKKKRVSFQAKEMDSSEASDAEDEISKMVSGIRKSGDLANKKYRKHYLNEGFFNVHEMHDYLDLMEREEAAHQSDDDNDSEPLDLFADTNDASETDEPIYMRDFEPEMTPCTKLDRKIDVQKYIDHEESASAHDESGEDMAEIFGGKVDPSKQSATEKKREKDKKKVKDLEELNLADKPWQLKGETSARARPENSLLTEAIDFDTLAKSAPVITNDYTEELEDVIKSRIRDLLFDDVERKVKPREDPYEYRKKLSLNSEKSQLSLAEIYEKDYLSAKHGADAVESNPESVAHQKIQAQMTSLFNKLDALSNYTFVPRPAAPEIQFIQNKSTVKVEQAGPLNVGVEGDFGSATQLAPEEVSNKSRLDAAEAGLKSKDERSATEKKREVRLKKAGQKARAEAKRERQSTTKSKPVVHTKNQRLTSTKFFGALEEEKTMAPIRAKQKAQKEEQTRKKKIASLKL